MKNEEDPLWDDPKLNILGFGFYKLEPLVYLINNPAKISIISQQGTNIGTITCDLIPHEDDNSECDEIPSNPYDLVGQPLNFSVYIKEANNLPENFCKGIQIEYTSFLDNHTNITQPLIEKTTNPIIENKFEHRIEYLTKEDIDYLIKEKVN